MMLLADALGQASFVPAQLTAVEWTRSSGESQHFDISTAPLLDEGGSLRGVQVSFSDVTALNKLSVELVHTTEELEGAHEELQSTSEELETTNEELQSTNEELETTNEELQSTNEELETTNEELRSTNEELQSINEEFRIRTQDLGRLNLYFESILTSLHSAVVVLDRDLHVQVWSSRAQEMWGLRSEEVTSQHFARAGYRAAGRSTHAADPRLHQRGARLSRGHAACHQPPGPCDQLPRPAQPLDTNRHTERSHTAHE